MKKIRSALAPVLSLLVILAGSPIPAQQVVEPVIERPGESLTVRSLKLANTFDSRTEMEFTFENTNSLVDAMLTLEPGLIRLEGFLTLVEVFLPTGQSAPSSGADERIPFEIETRQVHIAIPPSPEEDDDGDDDDGDTSGPCDDGVVHEVETFLTLSINGMASTAPLTPLTKSQDADVLFQTQFAAPLDEIRRLGPGILPALRTLSLFFQSPELEIGIGALPVPAGIFSACVIFALVAIGVTIGVIATCATAGTVTAGLACVGAATGGIAGIDAAADACKDDLRPPKDPPCDCCGVGTCDCTCTGIEPPPEPPNPGQ